MANIDAVHASGGLQSNSDKIVKDKGRVQSSTRKSASKITQKRAQKKKAPPMGSARDFPCRPCVTRATKNPGHECVSQDNTGAACWDCAKNGHTCRPVPTGSVSAVRVFWELNRLINDVNKDPDDAWHSAAQRAAQQLRACGAADRGAAAAPAHAPALARLGESAEPTLEERKVTALEAIAEAARLWTQLNKPDEEGTEVGEESDKEY
ncbi:hypothetical protein AUP68_11167 [Ilyonectria robusta]